MRPALNIKNIDKTKLNVLLPIIREGYASQAQQTVSLISDFSLGEAWSARNWQTFRDMSGWTTSAEAQLLRWDCCWLAGTERCVYWSESFPGELTHARGAHWCRLFLINWMGLKLVLVAILFPLLQKTTQQQQQQKKQSFSMFVGTSLLLVLLTGPCSIKAAGENIKCCAALYPCWGFSSKVKFHLWIFDFQFYMSMKIIASWFLSLNHLLNHLSGWWLHTSI